MNITGVSTVKSFKYSFYRIAVHTNSIVFDLYREILTPEKKLYSGEVYGVQMPGISGSFEVLDRHAPLVSALKPGRLKVLKDKQNSLVNFDIQGGFVEVLNNKVTVLVEGAKEVE